MDKNTITGLVIIGALVFGFTWWNSKKAEEYNAQKQITEAQQAVEDSIRLAHEALRPTNVATIEDLAGNDSLQTATQVATLGNSLFRASVGEEHIYTVENEVAFFRISNKGGRIVGVELKGYDNKFAGGPLQMISEGSAKFDMEFDIRRDVMSQAVTVNTADYYFETAAATDMVVTADSSVISMKLPVDSLSYVEYVYTIRKGEYMIDFDVNFVNMDRMLAYRPIDVTWASVAPQNEKGYENENKYTSIYYKYPGETGLENMESTDAHKSKSENTSVEWIAFKQQFFSSIFIAKDNFSNADMMYDAAKGYGDLRSFSASMQLPFDKAQGGYSFSFYYGPNSYSELSNYKDLNIQKLVPLGAWIIRWVNRYIVIPVFDFLSQYISSYGLIILLLTIFIKLLILPLTYKSHLSMAKMRVIKPEMDALNEKFPNKDDAMKKQMAMQELYKKAGVNPMGGCLPMLIQFPILIAMFRFFPASIELRGESFLWATDLSSYDSILQLPFSIPFYGDHVSLFTLLMAVSVFISSKINMSQQAASSQQMPGMKFMMLYMMPIMLLVWFNNYSSGLSYYYLLSNIITILQTYMFRKIVNEDKLHARMQERVANPKATKKSKWAQRYEEAVKMQMEQQGVKQPYMGKQRKKPHDKPKNRK